MAAIKPPAVSQSKPGLLESLAQYVGSAADYFGARLSLLGIEFKEAAGNYIKLTILVVTALMFLVFGLVFFVVFLMFGIQRLTHWDWLWILGGFFVLSFVATAGCLLLAWGRLKTKVLSQTIEEFKKDKQWLASKPIPSSANAS